MSRFARMVDANQPEIVEALRGVGASVEDLHAAGHCPDLLIGFRGLNVLLEVKSEHGRLEPKQREWHAEWRGQVAVVRSAWEALRAIGAVEDVSPSREENTREAGHGLAQTLRVGDRRGPRGPGG